MNYITKNWSQMMLCDLGSSVVKPFFKNIFHGRSNLGHSTSLFGGSVSCDLLI